MTRKMISAFLALILCLSVGLSVSATANTVDFVVDEFDLLMEEELSGLNTVASAIYEATGVGVFFAYVQTDDIEDYDVSSIVGDIGDYVLMMENETHWYMHLGGAGEIIDLAAEEALRAVYDEPTTYFEGVADFMVAAAEYFPFTVGPSANATAAETVDSDDPEAVVSDAQESFVYDEADLLTDAEEAALVEKLKEVSHARDAQIVIVTIASMDGGDIDEFVDYLYDSMGFGYGENHDGALLLVCMDPRQYRILSNGYAGVAIGPDQIDTLCDFMETYLPKGHYVAAFNSFADQCGEMLEYYQAGSPFKVGKNLVISLIIGILAGLLVAFILKGQLKSVRKQDSARVYVKKGSMQLNYSRDIFLYRNVTRTKKQERVESTSSGSGGSTRSKGGGSF